MATATKTAKTPARKPVPVDVDGLKERFGDFPALEVLTRRYNDPSDPGSLPILLKDENDHCCQNTDHQLRLPAGATACPRCKLSARKWRVRWFNLDVDGRSSQMRALGYIGVPMAMLKDANDVADLYRSDRDTYVRRGDRGQEILGYQPLEAHNAIKAKQREQRESAMRSSKRLRDELAENAGKELGDEAGQAIHDGDIRVESMKRHRATLGDEAEGEE